MSARARTSISSVVLLTTTALIVAFLSRAEGQTEQTKQVMQQKLAQSQQLLGALVTSNWATLTQRTQALESLTRQPGWQFLQTIEYRTYTAAFEKATRALAAGQPSCQVKLPRLDCFDEAAKLFPGEEDVTRLRPSRISHQDCVVMVRYLDTFACLAET